VIEDLRPGDVCIGKIYIFRIDPGSTGKPRPLVLIERSSTGWWTAGLTTRAHYRDSHARIKVPNPTAVGLAPTDSYIWGGKLVPVANDQIRKRIGHVDEALALALRMAVQEITQEHVEKMLELVS
jgi:hypothetical protein